MTKQEPNQNQARMAAIVVLVAIVGWMLVSFLGGKLGLPVRFAFLADFAAIGALIWAMIVLFKVWRQRQEGE